MPSASWTAPRSLARTTSRQGFFGRPMAHPAIGRPSHSAPHLHMSTPLRALSVSALLLVAAGASVHRFALRPRSAAASDRVVELTPLADAPLDPARVLLLDTAFEAASAIPLMPHVKTRSQAQEG